MPRPTPPPPLSVTLTLLRSARGWSQKDLAQVTGIPNSVLSDYEKGRRALSREKLEKMAAAMKMGPEAIEMSLFSLDFLQPQEESPDSLLDLDQKERGLVERAAAVAAREAAKTTRSLMTHFLKTRKVQKSREEAEKLWERLKRYSSKERRLLVHHAREFHSWALCERVCAESAKAAAADAGRALDLADLALRIAGQVPGPETWRSHVQGYAWAFVGNARRVASDLPAAEEAFVRAWGLWKSDISSEKPLLPEWRLLDLEASLRRAQRRLPDALKLLDRALAICRPTEQGRILLNKSFALEQLAEYERAIEALKSAAPLVDGQKEPRLLFALRFNLAVNLCHLGRQGDAMALVPEVRNLALQLGNPPDLIRVLWLEGRVLVGLRRQQEAMTTLEQVRAEFLSWQLPYDTALVSLELAALYLEDRRTAEVRNLARQMTPVFQAQGVHREALAALRLFCEAVDKETITVDMARRLAEYFKKARHQPGLRFQT